MVRGLVAVEPFRSLPLPAKSCSMGGERDPRASPTRSHLVPSSGGPHNPPSNSPSFILSAYRCLCGPYALPHLFGTQVPTETYLPSLPRRDDTYFGAGFLIKDILCGISIFITFTSRLSFIFTMSKSKNRPRLEIARYLSCKYFYWSKFVCLLFSYM